MEHPSDFHRLLRARGGRARRGRARARGGGGSLLVTMTLAGVLIGLVMPGDWRVRVGTAIGEARAGTGAAGGDVATARFGYCHSGGGTNCVVDGDTFWMAGEKIRIADIDTPETHPARCAREQRLGDAATFRLQALLNAGAVTLVPIDRDIDRYGRRLRVVERDGQSLGQMLVDEGLARPWEGYRRPWCGAED